MKVVVAPSARWSRFLFLLLFVSLGACQPAIEQRAEADKPGTEQIIASDGDERMSVRAAFDLSYAALADGPRRLFALIGLVPGPDLSAAAGI